MGFRQRGDDTDTIRLDGGPLFTLSDGKTDLLDEKTRHAFTWPREAPADLVAHAYDRCRWQALFLGNRMMVRMDPGWTQFERAHFTVPGKWVSPGGPARWKKIVGEDGKEYVQPPAAKVRVSAAELEFPGGVHNLAFKFEPAQEVEFNGLEMRFSIGSFTKDNWQLGFSRPGTFDTWRGKH